ncbi:hypothetical protein BHE74_00033872 [Ensete ventricosum]|nr:hypothetical protein BHE74_00033872 [Ensete ventricosum]
MGMGMGSRQSSLLASSASVIRDSSISVVLCTLIVALGPIQFGFTGGYSSPTQDDIIADLGLSLSEVPVYIAEIAPQNLRGALGSVNQVNLCF